MKVLIEAYTRLNLGDDLFIYTIINRYPHIDFYLITDYDEYENVFKKYNNIHIININKKDKFPLNMLELGTSVTNNMELKVELLKRIDATVVIGGSMFIQSEKWREWHLEYYQHLFYFSQWSPVFFMGCNFGPYYSDDYYNEFKNIFRQARDVCFREKFSYNLFKDLTNVRYSTDIVFGIRPYIDRFIAKQKDNRNIGISIISLKNRNGLSDLEEDYFSKIRDIIYMYYEKGYSFSIFPFCDFEGDLEAAQKLYESLNVDIKKKCIIYEYKGNIEEYLYYLSTPCKMICSRFHSIIMSLIFEQEILPLIYSEKSANILKDLNYNGNYYYIKNIKDIDVKKIYSEFGTNTLSVKDLESEANKQFYAFDEFLKELI